MDQINQSPVRVVALLCTRCGTRTQHQKAILFWCANCARSQAHGTHQQLNNIQINTEVKRVAFSMHAHLSRARHPSHARVSLFVLDFLWFLEELDKIGQFGWEQKRRRKKQWRHWLQWIQGMAKDPKLLLVRLARRAHGAR